MGVRFPSVVSNTFVGPLPANANETVVCTTPPLTTPYDNCTILLLWSMNLIAGATMTGATFRLRRGTTIAGATIFANVSWNFTTVAANALILSGWYFDSPGAVGGLQYSLTLVQVAATGASTFPDPCLMAFVL